MLPNRFAARPTLATMEARLRSDLRAALKERRPRHVAAIRGLLAALANAEAQPLERRSGIEMPRVGPGAGDVPRRVLDEREIAEVFHREIGRYESAIVELELHGVDATALRVERDVLESYRPGPTR